MASTAFPAMPGALRFRGTFIDQETAWCDGDAGFGRQRSSSVPCSPMRSQDSDTEDFFAREKAIVFGLSEFYCGLVSPTRPANEFIAADAVMESNANTSDILLRAKGFIGKRRQADDEDTVASVCTTLPGVDASDVSTISSSVKPRACNVGSIGHPELCSRPCIYYAAGRCANGVDCQFCHMPHDSSKKGVHLQKKHRASLERMTMEAAVAIVWPILQEKVLAFNRAPATTEALAMLKAALPGPIIAATELDLGADAGESTLARVLGGFNLRRVLLTLESATENLPLVSAATEALLVRLRGVALATA